MTPAMQYFTAIFVALVLLGCAVTPQQPGEAVAAAYESIIIMTETVSDAMAAGLLTPEQAEKAADKLEAATEAANAAQAALAERGDPGDHLADARAALKAVQGIVEAIR